MDNKQKEQLNTLAQTIYDKKGFNIVAMNVKGISSIADYVIIAEGNVDRHVQAISVAVVDEMKSIGIAPSHVEGRALGDWVVIDYLDIIVHLFMPHLREKYKIEELWRDGEIIELDIENNQKVNC
jgi:ribosome-associated protein